MKLGLAIGYSGPQLEVPVALVQRAEDHGPVAEAETVGTRLGRRLREMLGDLYRP